MRKFISGGILAKCAVIALVLLLSTAAVGQQCTIAATHTAKKDGGDLEIRVDFTNTHATNECGDGVRVRLYAYLPSGNTNLLDEEPDMYWGDLDPGDSNDYTVSADLSNFPTNYYLVSVWQHNPDVSLWDSGKQQIPGTSAPPGGTTPGGTTPGTTPPSSTVGQALNQIKTTVVGFVCIIYMIIQAIVGVLAVLMIILAGIKWMSSDDVDSRQEAKNRIFYAIIGVLVVLLALDIVILIVDILNSVLSSSGISIDTTYIKSQCTTSLSGTGLVISKAVTQVICVGIRILQGVAGIIAMILFTIAGFMWIAADSPEDRSGAKKLAVNTVIGVLIIILAVPAALNVLFFETTATEFDCPGVVSLTGLSAIITLIQKTACVILRTLQFASGFVAAMAVMYAGIRWLSSDSPESRSLAKTMALSAIFGFIVILIAAELVNTTLFSGMDPNNKLTFDCGISSAPSAIQNIIQPALCAILLTIQGVAGIIAAMVIMLSGIKWLSSDDPEDRSDAKRWVINAILGFFVVIVAAQSMGALFGNPGFTSYTCSSGKALPYVNTAICVIFNTIKAVSGVIAAMVIAFAGLKWMSSDDPDERNKAKRWIMNAIVGFFVVIIGTQLSTTLFTGISIANFTCGTTELVFVTPVFCVILKSIQAVAGIIASIVIALAGLKWLSFDVDFEERNKAKGLAINALIGLLIVIVGVQFMGVLFGTQASFTKFDKCTGTPLPFVDDPLCAILNIILAASAVIAGIAFLFSAFKWFIAGGDPESRAKAKGAVFNVIVGFLIVLIAAQFANLVLTGSGLGEFGCENFKNCACGGVGGGSPTTITGPTGTTPTTATGTTPTTATSPTTGTALSASFTATMSTEPAPPTVYLLDASNSKGATSYSWNCGGGDLQQSSTQLIYAMCSYENDGEYTITLTVSNGENELKSTREVKTYCSTADYSECNNYGTNSQLCYTDSCCKWGGPILGCQPKAATYAA